LLLIPAFFALSSSPAETTSAPDPNLFSSLSISKFAFDFIEKHISGLMYLNAFLKL